MPPPKRPTIPQLLTATADSRVGQTARSATAQRAACGDTLRVTPRWRQGLRDALHRCWRCASRRKSAKPGRKLITRHRFRHRRNVWKFGSALRPRDGQRTHLIGADLLNGFYNGRKHDIHAPGDKICHGRRSTAIIDMRKLHLRQMFKQCCGEMLRRARPRRTNIDSPRIGPRKRHQISKAFCLKTWMRHQHVGAFHK